MRLPSGKHVTLYLTVQFSLMSIMVLLNLWDHILNPVKAYDNMVLDAIVNHGEIASFSTISRAQLISFYTLVGAMLVNALQRIDELIREGGDEDLAQVCRQASRVCADISKGVSFALKAFYLEYAVRLITEIPMSGPEIRCKIELFKFCDMIFSLTLMLFVVSTGKGLQRSISNLRRLVRHASLTGSRCELYRYLQRDHEARLTAGTIVSWNTFSDFLGFIWSFTFMVLQWFLMRSAECPSTGYHHCSRRLNVEGATSVFSPVMKVE